MTEIEDRIQGLLERAAPLRPLEEDDPRKEELARLVDEINRLRRIQETESRALFDKALAAQGSRAAVEAAEMLIQAEQNAREQFEDDDLPSRAEMEAAASRLGVQYRTNLGDQKLLERLREAG